MSDRSGKNRSRVTASTSATKNAREREACKRKMRFARQLAAHEFADRPPRKPRMKRPKWDWRPRLKLRLIIVPSELRHERDGVRDDDKAARWLREMEDAKKD